MYDTQDYAYHLPKELIAQMPSERRDHSRLLMVDRLTGGLIDRHFFNLPELLNPGDLLVINNTQVVPARIYGRKASGGKIEVVILEHPDAGAPGGDTRVCLMKSSGYPRAGTRLIFGENATGVLMEHLDHGMVRICFEGQKTIDDLIRKKGRMPLPPYIKREVENPLDAFDRERYQTVYSAHHGAVAAPTAGLHFTNALMDSLKRAGVFITPLTLHVGYDTFRPVKTEDIRDHRLQGEYYRIETETADRINQTRKEGGRVVAVGTTVVRALESAVQPEGQIEPCREKPPS
ncbi:MAG: tRNA preQ1(34) S-adenosylmethionine ribosyltransferase-isomerase QueA [Deltaproteobacteria bacterium]|nr:tRNA preQ1(34) S-adenosylmethionine ribosyltransferase-isomerase QueA [Deltaproteobacteria bacterium]